MIVFRLVRPGTCNLAGYHHAMLCGVGVGLYPCGVSPGGSTNSGCSLAVPLSCGKVPASPLLMRGNHNVSKFIHWGGGRKSSNDFVFDFSGGKLGAVLTISHCAVVASEARNTIKGSGMKL